MRYVIHHHRYALACWDTYGNLGNFGGGFYIRASAPPVYRCASALSSNKVETDASRALLVQSDLVALSHYSPKADSPSWFPKITNFLHGKFATS